MANSVTKHIPNFITCCNLFSGCVASFMACMALTTGDYVPVFLWIGLGALFDFCDGLSARVLNAKSPIGKDLDSLADVVTFGVAPAFMCYGLLGESPLCDVCRLIPFIGFLIAIFSGVRLAKFNIDTRQTTSFLGLPVPANAIFWCGVTAFLSGRMADRSIYAYVILALIVVFSLLMVSEIPMFSLKFKNLSIKDNLVRFLFLIVSAALLLFCGMAGLSLVIVWFIVLSLLTA